MKEYLVKGFFVLVFGFSLWWFNPILREHAYIPFGEYVCKPFFSWMIHHWVEGFFGLVFGFLFWLFDPFLRERAYIPFSRWVRNVRAKISSSSVRVIAKNEINNSITANLGLEKSSLVFAINRHEALTNSYNFHYSICGDFHMERRFNLLPLLDGSSSFFDDACNKIADLLNDSNLNLVLYLEKQSNQLFANEVSNGLPRRIKIRPLGFDESRLDRIVDREIISLQGQNVITVDSVVCSPTPLQDLIAFVHNEGGSVLNAGILFNGLSDDDLSELLGVSVISAYNIDLKIFPVPQCNRCKSKRSTTKPLLYADYAK